MSFKWVQQKDFDLEIQTRSICLNTDRATLMQAIGSYTDHGTQTETLYSENDNDYGDANDTWSPPSKQDSMNDESCTDFDLEIQTGAICLTTDQGTQTEAIGSYTDHGTQTETLYSENDNDYGDANDTWSLPSKQDSMNDESCTETDDGSGTENIKQILTDMMKKKGPVATMEYVKNKMDRWRNHPVKFALIGSSAVGKSTYINTVRGVKKGMANWAAEGSCDTTKDVTEYRHPGNRQIIFYDIPGYGYKLSKEQLLKKIGPIDKFDYFLILFDKGISPDDQQMIKIITDHDKPFCLIRTKLDLAIMSGGERNNEDPKTVKDSIRKKIEESIKDMAIPKDVDLFLISCIEPTIGDFPDLFEHMKRYLSKAQYEAVMLTLPILTKRDIDKKFDELKSRISWVATTAGVISAIPIPFIDIPVNMYIVKREISLYIEAFLLNRDEVKDIPERKFNFSIISFDQFVRSAFRAFLDFGVIGAVSQLDVVVPVIGSAISFGVTSTLIHRFLLQTLTELKGEAIYIFNYMCNRHMYKT